jgi:hypothetical protein
MKGHVLFSVIILAAWNLWAVAACPSLSGVYTCASDGTSISISQTAQADTNQYKVQISRRDGSSQPMDNGSYTADGATYTQTSGPAGNIYVTAFCPSADSFEVHLTSDALPPAYGSAQRFTLSGTQLTFANGAYFTGSFNPSPNQTQTCARN